MSDLVADDPIHPEGIYQCNGCGRTYNEYVNGCLEEHPRPRSVRLIIPEPTKGERHA